MLRYYFDKAIFKKSTHCTIEKYYCLQTQQVTRRNTSNMRMIHFASTITLLVFINFYFYGIE